jgi:hypothetical protein
MANSINLRIDQGATFRYSLTLKDSSGQPLNLSGFGARMQVRKSISDTNILLELTSYNGRLVLGGTRGTLDMVLTDQETAVLDNWSTALYDVEIKAGAPSDWSGTGDVTRLISGSITLSLGVTR